MKKEYIKIILKILLVVIILNTYNTISLAGDLADVIESGEDFVKLGEGQFSITSTEMVEASNMLFNTLLTIGTLLSTIVGAIIGIKYMMASAEDKAKIKESMMPYVLGCIVIFGAAGIWKLCISLFSKL